MSSTLPQTLGSTHEENKGSRQKLEMFADQESYIESQKEYFSKGEEELGPSPILGGDVDLPAHQFYQLLTDGEAEACTKRILNALVADLREEPKETLHVLCTDPNARILDAHMQAHVVGEFLLQCGGHDDAALWGELDCVEEQIEKDLAQALLITHDEGR